MGYEEFYGEFQVKNTELRSLSDFAYECGVNTGLEQSAGMTIGLDEHALTRQRAWIENFTTRLTAIAARPTPDLPVSHPILLRCDYSEVPQLISKDGKALNGDAEAIMLMWQRLCYELVKSNSAGLGGGMTTFDARRCQSNVEAITQILDTIEAAVDVDFPETAAPEATQGGVTPKSGSTIGKQKLGTVKL